MDVLGYITIGYPYAEKTLHMGSPYELIDNQM
jgi:hypothetical protein